jgi:CP family cyanate transporter-like MFS transporter
VAPGLLAALLLATFVIRGPITSVPPALALVRDDLSLSATAAGLVTTLPVLCFGVFACVTPLLAARVGIERTLGVALAAICVGLAVRLVHAAEPFFAGTLLIGLGIAMANVVIPAIARAHFARSLSTVMGRYTVMIQVSGATGAFLTRPLVDGAGWSWTWAIGIWLGPAGLVLVVWVLAARGAAPDRAQPRPAGTRMRTVLNRPITWGIVLVMGLQSLVFFSLVNWLPTLLHGQGWSTGAAGTALGIFSLLGMPGSLLGGLILGSHRRTTIVVALTAGFALGLVLLVCGTIAAGIGVLLCGLCQGPALAVALSAIAGQVEPADVPATSAIGQGVGYLLAACGPVAIGALYGARGDFLFAMAALVGVMLVWGTATTLVGRAQADAKLAPTG